MPLGTGHWQPLGIYNRLQYAPVLVSMIVYRYLKTKHQTPNSYIIHQLSYIIYQLLQATRQGARARRAGTGTGSATSVSCAALLGGGVCGSGPFADFT
jgi:hypothetical protein